jgi:hypothetical protein
MRIAVSIFVVMACAHVGAETAQPSLVALSDSAEVRVATARHYSQPDSTVARAITIRGDTAFATIWHGSITATIARLERRNGRWVFVREQAYLVK